MELWPHQVRGLAATRHAMRHHKAVVAAAPTGSGKTIMMKEMAASAAERGSDVLLITHRRILLEQASRTFDKHGIGHGIVASGHRPDHTASCRLASLQTLRSWCLGDNPPMTLPPADLVIVDEAHANVAETARQVLSHYLDQGAWVVGFTATPVACGNIYEELVNITSYSEMIDAGVLVPAKVYGPDEADMAGIPRLKRGEFNQVQMARRVMESLVIGDIIEHFYKINPWQFPTVLFAPSVASSRWMADQFSYAGVAAEHIDGETHEDERRMIFARSEGGSTKVICSCGVLREGWDAPWIRHAILLQTCGALSTYLQICGRAMRSYRNKEFFTLADHSGAWHRHGPPDSDRAWTLDCDDRSMASKREASIEEGREKEPICCPHCYFIRDSGPKCPNCGYESMKSTRRIRQADGTLKVLHGPSRKEKKPKKQGDYRDWESEIYAACYANRTVAQMRERFKHKYGFYPPDSFIWTRPEQWHRSVRHLREFRHYASTIEKRQKQKES